MEAGTTLGPESVVAAITPLRADYGACAAFVAYVDSQWRRVYPYRPAFAGHPRGRRGVLRAVGRPEPGSKPWGIRIGTPFAGEVGFHVAETQCGRVGCTDEQALVPDGHRNLVAERPGGRTDGEAFLS